MKKFLLLITFAIGLTQFANAQLIECKGMGVLGQDPATLMFNEFDLNEIDHVVVEATAVIYNGDNNVTPGKVNFSDANESYDADFNYVKTHLSVVPANPGSGYHKGYYTATFSDVDANGITLNKSGNGDDVMAFYAYIYLTDGSLNMYSMTNDDYVPAFLHAKGELFPVTSEFTLPAYDGLRNVTIKVPLSDNEAIDNDQRVGVVTLYDDMANSTSIEFILNDGEKNFHIEELTLMNVSWNVTKITVEVYSPADNGDSFFVGTLLLTIEEQGFGCTLTQGYWKNHSEYGPAKKSDPAWDLLPEGADTEFFLSGMTYYEVLNTAVSGNKYYILAHQYIAAELNMLAGASGMAIEDEFDDATELLETYTPAFIGGLKGNDGKDLKKQFTDLGEFLDDYNRGEIGPGHCDEEMDYVEKSARIENESLEINDLKVYPNPVVDNARVSFMPSSDGQAVIDLYNASGTRVSRLMNKMIYKDVPVMLEFSSGDYNEGLYILRIQRGDGFESKKIQVVK